MSCFLESILLAAVKPAKSVWDTAQADVTSKSSTYDTAKSEYDSKNADLKGFKNSKYGNMDITNKVVEEILTIPLHSFMKEEYIQRVINGITSFFRK